MGEIKEHASTIRQSAEEQLIELEKLDYLTQHLITELTENVLAFDGLTVDACRDLYRKQKNDLALIADMILDYSQQSLAKSKKIIDNACIMCKNL